MQGRRRCSLLLVVALGALLALVPAASARRVVRGVYVLAVTAHLEGVGDVDIGTVQTRFDTSFLVPVDYDARSRILVVRAPRRVRIPYSGHLQATYSALLDGANPGPGGDSGTTERDITGTATLRPTGRGSGIERTGCRTPKGRCVSP